jgi:hypothetical protein
MIIQYMLLPVQFYYEMGAAVAQLVARWAADLQVERSILCLGCVSSKKFASLTQVAPGPNIAYQCKTGPKAAFIGAYSFIRRTSSQKNH